MSDWLLLRLPHAGAELATWLVVDARGAPLSPPQSGPLALAAPRTPGRRVAVLAGGSAKRTDLRVLCKPFAQSLRETPIPAPGENAYCETHPGVLLTYGGCHVCRRGDDERYSRW